MCETPATAEYLISSYLEKHDHGHTPLYFPVSLSPEMKATLIDSYVSSDNVNSNYLELVGKAMSTSELPLTAKTIYAAKKKYEAFVDNINSSSVGFRIEVSVAFSDNQDETA